MSIRTSTKDHFKELSSPPELVVADAPRQEEANPLIFWTLHDQRPCLVDLTDFSTGLPEPKRGCYLWSGPFTGRPNLIRQLASALQDQMIQSSEQGCASRVSSLREWWRLFDAMEMPDTVTGRALSRLDDVMQLTDLHAQAARDSGMSAQKFAAFHSTVSTVRLALGLPNLFWHGPGHGSEPKRKLPPLHKIKTIWTTLKHDWFSVVYRWQKARELLEETRKPQSVEDERLLANYTHFTTCSPVAATEAFSHPTMKDLRRGLAGKKFSERGFDKNLMYEGFYPNDHDIRVAFHLCLSVLGWNVQTLLDLRVDPAATGRARTPFLTDHPLDSSRYILEGYKEKGKSDHVFHGDWKTTRGPGLVITTLVSQTWGLREHCRRELEERQVLLGKAIAARFPHKEITKLQLECVTLRARTESVWLFTTHIKFYHLNSSNFADRSTDDVEDSRFLRAYIDRINSKRSSNDQIPYIVASDLRDAFAAFVWRSSGGSVLAVMKALGHRNVATTYKYLNNSLVNGDAMAIFLRFSNALWDEIVEERRLDPTILAMRAREGHVSDVHLQRLNDYRGLLSSRVGAACEDPFNPPKSIDPTFISDGKSKCVVQRCSICKHGIVTPESLPGFAMRSAELRWLKGNMSVTDFFDSDFQRELDNTVAALAGFDHTEMNAAVALWEQRISSGPHKVFEFRGLQRVSFSENTYA